MSDPGVPVEAPEPRLPPLDAAGILWLAAIDRVPISERIEWVKMMEEQVVEINASRQARSLTSPPVEAPEPSSNFTLSRAEIGLAIDAVAMLVNRQDRTAAPLLAKLQAEYKRLRGVPVEAPERPEHFVVVSKFSTKAAAEAFAKKLERKYMYMRVEVLDEAALLADLARAEERCERLYEELARNGWERPRMETFYDCDRTTQLLKARLREVEDEHNEARRKRAVSRDSNRIRHERSEAAEAVSEQLRQALASLVSDVESNPVMMARVTIAVFMAAREALAVSVPTEEPE